MIPFNPITDDEPAVVHSSRLKATLRTLGYIDENGPMGLTPLKALKRYFVAWAAAAFDWPRYTAAELYEVNKVLNEPDFPPLMVLHDLLQSAKLVRHYKGAMHITKTGVQLKSHPAVLWIVLAHHLLHVLDHSRYTRYGDQLDGDWGIFLGGLNIEAEVAVTEERLCAALFGRGEKEMMHDYGLTAMLYIHVLRPLCCVGLLEEQQNGRGLQRTRHFVKTPLWAAALPFESAGNATARSRQ